MNSIVRQLAEQATTTEKDGFQYFDKQKFAELIVKRCTDVLDEDSYLFPELGGYAHDIRKLFGVKDI